MMKQIYKDTMFFYYRYLQESLIGIRNANLRIFMIIILVLEVFIIEILILDKLVFEILVTRMFI